MLWLPGSCLRGDAGNKSLIALGIEAMLPWPIYAGGADSTSESKPVQGAMLMESAERRLGERYFSHPIATGVSTSFYVSLADNRERNDRIGQIFS